MSSGSGFEDTLRRFLDHFEKISNCSDEDVFLKEFMALKTQSQRYRENNTYPMETGQIPCNKKKNRFKDILPFEYTRVSLHPIEGVQGSDYINANYIMDMDNQVTYIAAQGPLPHTINDFWRMLWYHNIEIVVMACKVVEMAKPKCERYWPEVNQTTKYGAIQVTTLNEENISNDFVVRDLMAECQGEQQYIRQYHYNAWPDHGKPSSPEPILRMLDRIHDDRQRLDVPVVIHCSAGCGRTGTIAGIDIARTMLEKKVVPGNELSVYGIVEKMRQQRPAMVQAKDQYIFVYLAIAELCKRALGLKPNVPKKPNGRPIQPSPIPIEVSNGGESSDAVYQNAAAVTGTPPKRNLDSVRYENVQPPSISSGPSDVEDTQEKKKPVARTRNSVRNRGSSPADSTAVPALGAQILPVFEVDGGGRGESVSPDLRNNAPSPKPKPRGKRGLAENRSFDGNDNTAESRTLSPLPPAKPNSGTAPSTSGHRGGPPEPPPKVPKTIVTDMTSSSSSLTSSSVGKKKPLPPPPPRKESTPERHSGGAFVPKKSSTGSQDRTEVLDERSGKTLPLDFVEREMDNVGEADTSKSSSILDAIMSLVGDDVLADVEKDDDEPDVAELTTVHRNFSFSDEAPPIPAHTLASMELVEPAVPTPRDGGGGGGGAVGGGRGNEEPLLSTYDVVGATADSVYEQPAEPPRLVLPISSQKASSFHGPHEGKSIPPPLPSPNRPTESSSTAIAISTMARSTNSTTPNNISGHTKQKKGLFSAFKKDKKKDKDKVSTEEVSGPVPFGTGIVKSPSINTMSSSTSSSHSPMHDRANNKYNFPGDLGYGIRIKKPVGPRREPPHWANSLLPPIANKA